MFVCLFVCLFVYLLCFVVGYLFILFLFVFLFGFFLLIINVKGLGTKTDKIDSVLRKKEKTRLKKNAI